MGRHFNRRQTHKHTPGLRAIYIAHRIVETFKTRCDVSFLSFSFALGALNIREYSSKSVETLYISIGRGSITHPAQPDFDLRNRGHKGTARLPYSQRHVSMLSSRRVFLSRSKQPSTQRHKQRLSFIINRPSVRCGPSAKLGRHLRSRFRCSMCSAVRMD